MRNKRRTQARALLRRKRSRLGSTGTCLFMDPDEKLNNEALVYIVQAIKLMRENPEMTPVEAVAHVVWDEDLKVILAKRLKVLLLGSDKEE